MPIMRDLMCQNGHAALNACPRCTIPGVKIGNQATRYTSAVSTLELKWAQSRGAVCDVIHPMEHYALGAERKMMCRFMLADGMCRVPRRDGSPGRRIPSIHLAVGADNELGVPHGYAACLGGDNPTAPPTSVERLANMRSRLYVTVPRVVLGFREQCWSSDEMVAAAAKAERVWKDAVATSVNVISKGAVKGLPELPPPARRQAWKAATEKANQHALQVGIAGWPIFLALAYCRYCITPLECVLNAMPTHSGMNL